MDVSHTPHGELLRIDFNHLLRRHQHDINRLVTRGALENLTEYFRRGVWAMLSPKAQTRFVLRLGKFKGRTIDGRRKADNLRYILDHIEEGVAYVRLRALEAALDEEFPSPELEAVRYDIPADEESRRLPKPAEHLAQQAEERKRWMEYLGQLGFPAGLHLGDAVSTFNRLCSIPSVCVQHDAAGLFLYTLKLNLWAHRLAPRAGLKTLSQRLFRRKSDMMLVLMARFPQDIVVRREQGYARINLDRNGIGGAGLHIPIRHVPRHLFAVHSDSWVQAEVP